MTAEPRFATPRNPNRATVGGKVAQLMKAFGHDPMPWQRDALAVACELDPATGSFWYDQVIIVVLRRAGKTSISRAKVCHRALTTPDAYIQYTAQDRNKALTRLIRDFYTPISKGPLASTIRHFSTRTGSEHLSFTTGSELFISAISRKASHGDTLHEAQIDEAFAHPDSSIEDGADPALMTVRGSQKWVLSAAGDASSHFLRGKVELGRALVEAGRPSRTCYIEYSAPDEADPNDPATVAGCHPAIGITLDLDRIMSAREGMDAQALIGWERAWLGRWPRVDLRPRVLPVEAWEKNHVTGEPWEGLPLWVLDISPEREYSTIAIAANSTMPDRKVYLEAVEQLLGTTTVVARLQQLRGEHGGDRVVIDKSGAARALVPDLEDAGFDVTMVDAPQRVDACGGFHDDVLAGALAFPNDPLLNDSMEAARRHFVGGGRAFIYVRDTGDITALYAVVLGRWAYLDTAGDDYDTADSIL